MGIDTVHKDREKEELPLISERFETYSRALHSIGVGG